MAVAQYHCWVPGNRSVNRMSVADHVGRRDVRDSPAIPDKPRPTCRVLDAPFTDGIDNIAVGVGERISHGCIMGLTQMGRRDRGN